MSYNVYIHTNKVNGKRYVGVTIRKPEQRWNNGEGYKEQPHFYSAIKKYGWDNFEHFIVEVDSREKMFELEKQYIEFYQTTNPEKGYNKSFGGESGAYLGKNSNTKEYWKNKTKEYYDSHKEEVDAYRKQYWDSHREERKEYKKRYDSVHREEMKQKCRYYYDSHREELLSKQKEYYCLHKREKKEYDRLYYQKKKHKDVEPITPLW